MFQSVAPTFIGSPDALVRFFRTAGADMNQLVGANTIVLDEPVNNEQLAAAIVATPAGRALIDEAVEEAVAKMLAEQPKPKQQRKRRRI